MNDRGEQLKNNLLEVKFQISSIVSPLKKAWVNLVAVTKYSPLQDLILAYLHGHREFGENRVQDLMDKANAFAEKDFVDVKWHFIGNLQTNKINKLLKVPQLKFIHSVDSIKLLEALYKRVDQFTGEELYYFLEVKTSDEDEKAGLADYDELARAVNLALKNQDSKLKLHGLMTMGKIRTDDFEKDAAICFKKLMSYKKQLEKDFFLPDLKLSMGMSRDFHIAVEQGSDFVRVGSKIFK
jgi:pyridoxal phosphate enzyme (YggS family)